MDKEFLISYLKKRNYWWQTKNVTQSDRGTQRKDYLDKIQETDRLERIICLSGIRRSGKTTILFQYLDQLLQKKRHIQKRYTSSVPMQKEQPDRKVTLTC
ncbi:putative ATPase AAA+ superfamily [groundwater metagenome]